MSFMIPTPMKYKEAKTPEERMATINDPNVVLTVKKDGASYMLCKDLEGEVHMYSGGISKKNGLPIDKIDNVPHLKEMAEKHFPNGSLLIGEICSYYDWKENKWCEHSASKRVSSIMGCNAPLAISRQNQTKPVEFYLFDVLFWDGEDWFNKDFQDRYRKLSKIRLDIIMNTENEKIFDWLTIVELIKEDKEATLAQWFAEGREGAMCYRLHSDGKKGADYVIREIGSPALRRDNGTKIKTMSTYDVVILGVEAPEKTYNGKYADTYEYRDEDDNPVNRLWALGMANAFSIGCYDENGELVKIGTVASGLTDEIRKDAADNVENYIGRVIEVRCMSADSKNKTLRHPVFLQFRDDKDAVDCTEDTIF